MVHDSHYSKKTKTLNLKLHRKKCQATFNSSNRRMKQKCLLMCSTLIEPNALSERWLLYKEGNRRLSLRRLRNNKHGHNWEISFQTTKKIINFNLTFHYQQFKNELSINALIYLTNSLVKVWQNKKFKWLR